jgi:hypothetical protein
MVTGFIGINLKLGSLVSALRAFSGDGIIHERESAGEAIGYRRYEQ